MSHLRSVLIATPFLLVLLLGIFEQAEPKILAQCDAVKELQKAGVSRTMISNWVCLMQSESGLNTSLMTGPKTASSYNFGVFQISSLKWCARGRKGGVCNKRCEEFIDDDISDDIVCALKIQDREGFKQWNGWLKKCKNKPLPNIGQCKRRRRRR